MYIILQNPDISGQSMVLDLVDGVLPIVLVDAKGLANPPPHCLLTLLKPFFTSEMVVRDLTTVWFPIFAKALFVNFLLEMMQNIMCPISFLAL